MALLAPSAPLALILALALTLAGCVTGLGEGDRLFLAGDLRQAEVAYRIYLTSDRPAGPGAARARYRLGLIYALQESPLHDWKKADRTLRELIEIDPGSSWAQQAELLLSLHAESVRLERDLDDQSGKVSLLLAEVAKLQQAARETGDVVEDRDARLAQLTGEIAELRKSIGQLGDRLTAREKELDRIKKIDLQTPP